MSPASCTADLSGRRGEDETDRRRPEAHREQRVGLRGDAADLDEQAAAHRAPTVSPTSWRSWARSVGRPHQRLADQNGVVAGVGQPPGVVRVTDPRLGHGNHAGRDPPAMAQARS